MPRVFVCLVIADAMLFGGAMLLGLVADPDRADRHVVLAVLSLLLAALIQVLAFMYLAVGARIARQAAHQGGVGSAVVARTNAKKREMTPLIGLIVVSLVAVVATGASGWRSASPRWFHSAAVLVLIAVHAWVWVRQYDLICRFSADLRSTLDQHGARRGGKTGD